MKSSLNPVRKHGVTIQEWLLIFLVALAAHLLLFSLFRPVPYNIAESHSGTRYTVFLDEKDLGELSTHDDPHELGYWLRYTDPERLLKPDFEAGFSMVCGKNEISVPDPVQFRHALFKPVFRRRFPADRSYPERFLPDFVSGAGMPVFPHGVKTPAPVAEMEYPIWTDETGKISGGLFYADRDSVRLIKRQRAAGPGVFRLLLREDHFPEVELLRSCGNSKLDMLAVRQLKARKANFEPGKRPLVKYFTVVWRMPDLNTVRKERQP